MTTTYIFAASLPYNSLTRMREIDEAAWNSLRDNLPAGRLPPFGARGDYWQPARDEWVCDMAEALVWSEAGIGLEVNRLKGVSYPVHPTDALRGALNGAPPTVLNISVSNAGLYDVRSVTYQENACTDALQAMLDRGWRLLAVCPPNDARRPTYILGHADPTARA